MNYKAELKNLCALSGPAGYERAVSEKVEALFGQFCQEVWHDSFHNVYARMGRGGPRLMVCAHMDEVGMMVRTIEKDGFLGITKVGGIDPRVLPAHEVVVHGREELFGVIGAKPPHVTTPAEREKMIPLEELYVDLGLPADRVRQLVQVGDVISYRAPVIDLAGDAVSGRTLDDRAGVMILLETMAALKDTALGVEIVFVATVGEEVGSMGAAVAAFDQRPDLGIAIDVTHGDTPDAPAGESFPMDRPNIGLGPICHTGWVERLRQVAREQDIDYSLDVFGGESWTDGDEIQLTAEGIPVALLSLPLRYMHTSVEVIRMDTLKKCARLLTQFILSVSKEG